MLSFQKLDAELRDQLRRAALSVPLNIAEAAGRSSQPDAARHYAIARGSTMECAAVLDVVLALGGSSRKPTSAGARTPCPGRGDVDQALPLIVAVAVAVKDQVNVNAHVKDHGSIQLLLKTRARACLQNPDRADRVDFAPCSPQKAQE
jgi:hypothetical protein